MLVYVINSDGQPLMPTRRCGKVRRLLKEERAIVLKRCPFTIRLQYETGNEVQEVTLGIDAGSKVIGLSATTEKEELYAAEVQLRTDIVDLLSTRRELRRSRRNRKIRYREPRFDNRVRSKNKGWLAPSIEQRIGTHFTVVKRVCRMLPISKIIVETASFDIQKIRNPEIAGKEYQQGDQLGFWNVREYVLFRDGHRCQCCKGKSKNPVLNVHHIESRKTGGDAPNNLVTLCETCHERYHKGEISLPVNIKRGMKFNDAAFMGIMRWAFYNRLKETYPNVSMTYGYITKHERIAHGLPKAHHIDARCISSHPDAAPLGYVFYQKKVRCHNRRLHRNTILKGGVFKASQAPYIVKGFRLYDQVWFKSQEWFVHGRRLKGSFVLSRLDGQKTEVTPTKLKFIAVGGHYITERRPA